ncbi:MULTISPECIES: tetratricopeptide repeat protein [Nostoc]|uniref:Tetratricopeptide repeat protein n=1 Tax=Nostoc paludosum FACHB-159 TaxID=2692908 RepID=A0ABR8KA61_9NOSO|nr:MULTISPECIES: tetratricopeptide repeat protein [Nostoc]MBD2679611.1 tetratricopeptide repeat protein [Nostoc sp. FACHB-857]MBD2735195.1 tetratricopeptide repeat protein [Nostoc paludosum FACHB-159]
MNPQNKPKNLQDIIKQRQQLGFVGREDQINQFRQNLTLPPEDDRRHFLYNIWGEGGVGKSTLVRQFRKIAEEAKNITAYIDEAEKTVPEVMGRLAEDLERQGHKLPQFSERYKVYRQKRQELETDPDAPQGFSAFMGKTVVKTGVRLARRVPVGGAVFDFVDEDALATQAGEWASYVAKKITNKDEVRLVQEPIEVLTPLFLQDIFKICEKTAVALFFDTYERTGEFLDNWLREILEGRHGQVSFNILITIAGRQELDKNLWTGNEGLIVSFPLEPFTEEETRKYLTRKGITNSQHVEEILRLSGNLPLLVGMLTDAYQNNSNQIIEPSSSAVERFLKWVDEPKRRQVAVDAAIARCLNRDIVAQLRGEQEADELFTWLKEISFVNERTDGWAYHDVVKMLMLRHKRLSSPQGWAEIHGKLANYYDTLRNELQLEEEKKQRDPSWQSHTLNVLYHSLCQSPQRNLSVSLNEFLVALKNQRKFAQQWAETMLQAGKDADSAEVKRWGEQLTNGLKAYEEDRYQVTVEMFTAVLQNPSIQIQWQSIALGWRGKTYRLMKRYTEALQDFDRAIELDPKYAWAIANRGVTYRLMKRYTEALQDFDRAIELDPKYAWAIAASRGQTYYLMERYTEALQDFDRAIELDPKYAPAIVLRGETYRLMERYTEALQDFDRAIKFDLKFGWLIALRGITYHSMERYTEALQDFDRAIELDPKYAPVIALRGQTYRSMERYMEALQDFDRAIELDPKDSWAMALRGETYRLMERYTEALQDFDRAIELDPKDAWAIASRGETYCSIKQYTQALQDFDRAIELDPKLDWAITSRGETYCSMKQYTQALQDFDRAIELDPKYAWVIASRGEIYCSMKQYTQALQDFDRAIEIDPKDAWAIASRGETYRLMERYSEALEDFDRAIELDPKFDFAIIFRGQTYLMLKRYNEALADFNCAIDLDSGSDWKLYNRALAYLALNQPDKARTDLTLAIKLAKEDYEKDPKDWRAFNLALYYLAAQYNQPAEQLYRYVLSQGASLERIHAAIQDLNDFLTVFPNHVQATSMRQLLQSSLT